MRENDTAANAIANEIMCSCSGTTRGKIYDLVMQGKDFDEISQWTGVNTGCSGCEWDILEFVNALLESKPAKDA
jgi:bacterioferritin-associated ferredoxin